jgi:SAM-dependent methyltransferase
MATAISLTLRAQHASTAARSTRNCPGVAAAQAAEQARATDGCPLGYTMSMSPEVSTPGALRRVRFSVETLGLRRAALELLPRHRPYEPAEDRSFDERHGTDTAGSVAPEQLGIEAGRSRDAAILYLPSPRRVTDWMLDRAGVMPASTTFVDLGCGKGRVLLVAAARPFERVVGIEISTDLVAIARANVARYRPPPVPQAPIDIVHGDVTAVDLPQGDLLVHLYHPFETPVTAAVLDRLAPSAADRSVTIAYLAYTEAVPRVRALLDGTGWLHEVRYEQSVRGHYNWLLFGSRRR